MRTCVQLNNAMGVGPAKSLLRLCLCLLLVQTPLPGNRNPDVPSLQIFCDQACKQWWTNLLVQYSAMWCSHFWCLLRVESISRRSKYCTTSSYIAYKSACDRADQATVPSPPALIIRGRSYHNLGTNFYSYSVFVRFNWRRPPPERVDSLQSQQDYHCSELWPTSPFSSWAGRTTASLMSPAPSATIPI